MLQMLVSSRVTRKGMDIQEFLSFELCRSSVEEVSSKSSRKMQDKEETTPEASWAAVAGRKIGGVEAGARRGNGNARSHSFVERGRRRLCEP